MGYTTKDLTEKGFNWTNTHRRTAKGGLLRIITSYIRHGTDHLNHKTLQEIMLALQRMSAATIWVGDFNRSRTQLFEEEAIGDGWDPSLRCEVETTCTNGGLTDYALCLQTMPIRPHNRGPYHTTRSYPVWNNVGQSCYRS